MAGPRSPELATLLVELAVEVVDHRDGADHVRAPRIGHVQALEQLAAASAEQIRDRTGRAPGHQRRVHALLQPHPLADQVEAPAGALALGADLGVGEPDRRHQADSRELGQDPGVDLVGLAGQRGQALDLLGVGDVDLPAAALERVVDEAGTGHRLDRRADRLAIVGEALGEPAKAVGVGRRGADVERAAVVGERVVVEPAARKVESNVQHESGPPWWIAVTGVSLPPGGPPSWHYLFGSLSSSPSRSTATSDPVGWFSGRRRADSLFGCRPGGLTTIALCRSPPPEDRRPDLIGAWHRPQ